MVSKNIENNIRQAAKIMTTGDFSSYDQIMAEDATYRTGLGDKFQGLEDLKKLRELYADAFDDFTIEPQHIFGEGNRAVVIYKQSGTHVGEFMGIEASHNRWEQLGCNIVTLDDDGKLVDVFDIFDNLELLKQLDAVPKEMSELVGGVTGTRPGA